MAHAETPPGKSGKSEGSEKRGNARYAPVVLWQDLHSATTGGIDEFDRSGPCQGVSSRVQAVCAAAGPTDFMDVVRRFPDGSMDATLDLMAQHLGGKVQDNPEKAARANPITYITADAPPFLLLHGNLDNVVPVSQSEILHEALIAAGVESTLRISKGGGHFGGGSDDPEMVQDMIMDFYDKHLR